MTRRVLPVVTFKFEVPDQIRRAFPKLLDKFKKNVVRQAIRSAILPAQWELKAALIQLAADSRQSSGASLRAITNKIKQHKSYPYVFYGIVGVNRKYIEAIAPEVSPAYPPAIRQVSFGIKVRQRNGEVKFHNRYPRKEVRSSLRKRTNTLRKRVPNKYWHLVLYGFNATDRRGPWAGRRTRFFAGHNFVENAIKTSQARAQEVFVARLIENLNKYMQL